MMSIQNRTYGVFHITIVAVLFLLLASTIGGGQTSEPSAAPTPDSVSSPSPTPVTAASPTPTPTPEPDPDAPLLPPRERVRTRITKGHIRVGRGPDHA